MNITLKYHAWRRIVYGNDDGSPRTELSPSQVEEILRNEEAVPIGIDPKDKDVIYRLFYSNADSCFFVSLQDEKDPSHAHVITIIPLHKFRNQHQAVASEALDEAIQLAKHRYF